METDQMTESGVRRGYDFFRNIEKKIDGIVTGQGDARTAIALIQSDIEILKKGEGKFVTKTTLENCLMKHSATCKARSGKMGWQELAKIIGIAVASAGAGGAGVASLWGG
ncbi:MAG: hypothetical protein JRC86_07260 [Deltaproteobacteria bacterium]|nr:hypothetical protein [Deltaproteobacteria bacterium]